MMAFLPARKERKRTLFLLPVLIIFRLIVFTAQIMSIGEEIMSIGT